MKTFYFIITSIAIFSSCAVPEPVVKIAPSTVQNKDYWTMGQQFVYSENQNVYFDCAFNRVENGKIIYDVKITNESDSAILVDPAMFMQMVFKNDSQLISRNYADDPESVLLSLNLQENTAVANAKNTKTLAITSAVLLVGAAIAVAATTDNNSNNEGYEGTTVVEDEPVEYEQEPQINIRSANNWTRRDYLSQQFLRKTTLPKGFYIDGEVHFPYYQEANWYRIIFKVGKKQTDFYFKQNLIYPSY